MKDALLPTWNEMYSNESSVLFRQPIGPDDLGISNYTSIVTNPMDLSIIKTKLTTGQYTDPWQYVDDVMLMFDNVQRLKRPKSLVACADDVSYTSQHHLQRKER